MFSLELDDSKKAIQRRQGLNRNKLPTLLRSLNRPATTQGDTEVMPATKTRAGSDGIARNPGSNRSQKRDSKGPGKENADRSLSSSSTTKRKQSMKEEEEEDINRLPDDSDQDSDSTDELQRHNLQQDSSDNDSPNKVSADMTKTWGASAAGGSKTSSTQNAPKAGSRKSARTQLSELSKRGRSSEPSYEGASSGMSTKGEKTKAFNHKSECDDFRNLKSTKTLKPTRSYTNINKAPRPPKPGRNSYKKSPIKSLKKFKVDSDSDVSSEEETSKSAPKESAFVNPAKLLSPGESLDSPEQQYTIYHNDNDMSGLDSPTKIKPTTKMEDAPSTQFQRFGEDEFLGDAEELVQKVRAERPLNPNNTSATHLEDDSIIDSVPRCPMCKKPVNEEDLKAFGEMNTRKQEKFCRSHQKKSAQTDWKSKGYPDIDWMTLDSRIEAHYSFIKNLINGADCHHRTIFEDNVKSGKDRNLLKSTTNLIPGYYGSRGLRTMSENIMNRFTPLLKKRAPQDRLVAARSPTAFVQSVVVPELTVLLIKEDMHVGVDEAREILKDSSEMGDLVNEEIKDVVKMQIVDSEGEDDSYF